MKPVKLLCLMFLLAFWTWSCTTFNSIPIILKLLTNRNIVLIYSVIICEQKAKDCARSGSFQHNLQHRCFQLWCLPAFITSLFPLTMEQLSTTFIKRTLFIDHYSSINVKPPLCLFPQCQFCCVFYYYDSTMQPESMKGNASYCAKVF